jgi:hypothetical protein
MKFLDIFLLKQILHQNNHFSPCSSRANIKTTVLVLAQAEQASNKKKAQWLSDIG